jgi:hypothetical protein
MRNSEPGMYTGLSVIRNGYMQMQWSRAQMYVAFHTLALPLIFSPSTDVKVRLVIGLVGIWVSVCIPIAIWRGNIWTKFYNTRMAELERLDAGQDVEPRVKIFSHPDFDATSGGKLASRKLFAPVAIGLTILWTEETLRNGLFLYR